LYAINQKIAFSDCSTVPFGSRCAKKLDGTEGNPLLMQVAHMVTIIAHGAKGGIVDVLYQKVLMI